jgi:type III pantothenate kinase
MVSAAVYGYAGLVDALVKRFKAELKVDARVIGTGGMIDFVAPYTESIEIVDHELTLKGLLMLYTMNQAYAMEMSTMRGDRPPPE